MDIKPYYDYAVSPLGELFYRTAWSQLADVHGMKMLDFGSGFAFTANHFAKDNDVTAIEIDEKMIAASQKSELFTQLHGDIGMLESYEDETFDIVVCHLVLEFAHERERIISQLSRVLKKGGKLSVIRHNRAGRIAQAIARDYDLEDAKKLLSGGHSYSGAFGDIKYYENEDIVTMSNGNLQIGEVYGIRALASIHSWEKTLEEGWLQNMLETEMELCTLPEFAAISFFKHIIYNKVST